MPVTSGFFNSKNGDRTYNTEQISRYFDKLIGSGVIPVPGNALQVMSANNGMNIQIMAGRGFVDCHWLDNSTIHTMTLDPADVVLSRIDAVVMRLDTSEAVRNLTIEIKKGTYSNTPTAPEMTRNEYVREYCLAHISVPKMTEVVTQSLITDTRANSNICGWVVALIDTVDTSSLFLQWQDAYATYYDTMTSLFEEWFTNKQNDFAAWFAQLSQELSVGAYIQEHRRTYNNTEEITSMTVGLEQYDPDNGDLLEVHVNGIYLTNGVDYTVTGTGADALITFVSSKRAGQDFEVKVFKSVLGTRHLVEVDPLPEVQ